MLSRPRVFRRVILAFAAAMMAVLFTVSTAGAGCEKGVEKKLHQTYKKWCDKSGPRSCKKKIKDGDCDEYKKRAQINKNCAAGRKKMTDTCYDGKFDKGHKKAYDDAVSAYKTCMALYKKHKCK